MKKVEEFKIEKGKLNIVLITCLISSLFIALMSNFDIGFYNKIIIIPFFTLVFSYAYLLNRFNYERNKNAYLYLIPIFLTLISNLIIEIDEVNLLLNVIVLPLLISVFLLKITNTTYSLNRQVITWFVKLFPKDFFYNFKYITFKKEKSSNNSISNIVIGVLISIPIAFALIMLLSSADAYFNEFINKIFSFIPRLFNITFLKQNIFIIIVSFLTLFTIFINVIKNRNVSLVKKELKSINKTVALTVLGIVNFVFVLFLISEISKITVNFLRVPIEYTHAQYAREGFFELLGVTVINASILFYFMYFTKDLKNNKAIKTMLYILISFSLLLICNSYYRMLLYIFKYGFTVLRTQVMLFLAMETVMFIMTIINIKKDNYKDKFDNFVYIMITTYLLNVYICNNTVIDLINKI